MAKDPAKSSRYLISIPPWDGSLWLKVIASYHNSLPEGETHERKVSSSVYHKVKGYGSQAGWQTRGEFKEVQLAKSELDFLKDMVRVYGIELGEEHLV
jgi:hypothetical protein